MCGVVDHGGVDIEVCDAADAARGGGESEDAGGGPAIAEAGGVEGEAGVEIDKDHVGLDVGEVDAEPGDEGEGLCETEGVGVVFGEAVAVVAEGVETGAGEEAGLAHGTAEELAGAKDAADGFGVADDGGPDGCAEPLAEANADGVERLGVVAWGDAGGGGRVPESSAVEVESEVVVTSALADGVEAIDGPDGAAAAVVGVLEDDEA